MAPFTSNEEACRAIAAIFKSGVAPSGMEFVEREAIERTQKYLKEEMGENVVVDLPVNIQAHLLMELDGNDDEVLMRDAETILEVLEDFDTGEVLFADNQSRKDLFPKSIKPITLANSYPSLSIIIVVGIPLSLNFFAKSRLEP